MGDEYELPKHLRIMVVDDDEYEEHAVYTEALGDYIVGRYYDGRDIVQKYEECLPDVVLMDWSMPFVNGEAATADLTAAYPQATVFIVSWAPSLKQALAAGAKGAWVKTHDPVKLREMFERSWSA